MGLKTIGRFVYDSATAQSVDAGSNLPLPTATVAGDLTSDGETVTINQAGVYLVLASATLDAQEAGTIEVQLHRNGNPVPGAHAYATAAAEDDYAPIAFSAVVSIPRCGQATVSVRAVEAVDVVVAEVIVMKVA